MWKEFKAFAFKSNVMDLAVGVMIGAAFNNIVNSIVNDIFMPLFGLILNTKGIAELYFVLRGKELVPQGATLAQAKEAGATVMSYGQFISAILNFLIIAIIIFLVVKAINKLRSIGRHTEEVKKDPRLCPYCKMEISDEATRCPHCTSELELPEDASNI